VGGQTLVHAGHDFVASAAARFGTVAFPTQQFVVTGRFAFGTRQKVCEAISGLGGIPGGSKPTKATRYFVIGTFASRDWYNTNYGRKIERAVELRTPSVPSGTPHA
jgi:hypothetical protein